MGYTIIVVKVPTDRAKSVVARHLAADPDVSLEKAMRLLDSLPVVYSEGLDKNEATRQIRDLRKLGVGFRVAESRAREPCRDAKPQPAPEKDESKVAPRKISLVKPVRLGSAAKRIRRGGGAFGIRSTPRFNAARLIAALALCAGLGYVLYVGSRTGIHVEKTGPILGKSRRAARGTMEAFADEKRKGQEHDSTAQRAADSLRVMSSALADSARASGGDIERAIKFYRIALSFNRRNSDAWYGLIGAYRSAAMDSEAAHAESEMKEEFGDDILSIQRIVAPYGAVEHYERGHDGTFRLKYVSEKRGRAQLVGDTYLIMRALRLECGCSAISLYAATGEGSGLLAHLKTEPFPLSLGAYESRATISYLE